MRNNTNFWWRLGIGIKKLRVSPCLRVENGCWLKIWVHLMVLNSLCLCGGIKRAYRVDTLRENYSSVGGASGGAEPATTATACIVRCRLKQVLQ
jgi:hypothetical protein